MANLTYEAWVKLIEQAIGFQCRRGKFVASQTHRQPLQQLFTVLCTVFTMLLILNDVIAREPRPRRYAAVNDHERILLQRL